MARTTLDIDQPVLKDLKRLQKAEKKSLGQLVSELVAEALPRHELRDSARTPFRWASKAMGTGVNLADKDAVFAVLDRDIPRR